jgi:glycosyltransferase involved in cell wall biosynthesis
MTEIHREAASHLSRPIAIVLPTLLTGGAEKASVNLANALCRLGRRATVVLLSRSGPLASLLDADVEVRNLGRRPAVRSVPSLRRYLRAEKPAAVFASLNANTWAVIAEQLERRHTPVVAVHHNRIITTDRHDRYSFRARAWVTAARLTLGRATAVATVSDDARDELAEALRWRQSRIAVIDNPLDLQRLDAAAATDEAHPWLSQRACIVAAGSLRPVKHFDLAIRALALLPEHSLVIYGEGPERAPLTALADELGVGDRLALPGLTDNPFASMRRAAVVVSTSLTEAQPVNLMEAIALGAPVVTTNSGTGALDLVSDYSVGAVAADDPSAVADAIRRVGCRPAVPDEVTRKRTKWDAMAVAREYLRIAGVD